METPIVWIVFNRPRLAALSLAEIAKQRPEKLLIVSDGPRSAHSGDDAKVQAVRSLTSRIEWPCEVLTNYSQVNLGCKQRISSGLDWAFQHVDRAIILEDDCLPNASFFPFCEELLQRYADDDRIMSIGGDNFQGGHTRTNHSYYFSKYHHCWGWATWRTAWSKMDLQLRQWPDFLTRGGMQEAADTPQEEAFWRGVFERQHRGEIDSWAYPWQFTGFCEGTLSVVPERNLVSNIGFGDDATHTINEKNSAANLPTNELVVVSHPESVQRNVEADCYTFSHVFTQPQRKRRGPRGWWRSLRKRIVRVWHAKSEAKRHRESRRAA